MVCHRFHAVALRILKPRLRAAALREDLKIQLLCTPPGIDTRVFCSYSGTDEPKDNRVSGLYARFRPEAYSPNGSPLVPQGRIFFLLLGTTEFMFANFGEIGEKDQRLSVRQVALEDFEHFCQLQTKVDLALAHGRAYIAPSFNLHRDFIRVRREWLEKQTGSNIMWIDANEGVGLRVRPHAKGTGKPPNVDYNLDIEGM